MEKEGAEVKKTGVQFIKFALVGILNTGVDWAVFFLLTLAPYFDGHQTFAKIISFTVAVINSFILNTIWTFRAETKEGLSGSSEEKLKKGSEFFIKFAVVSLIGLSLNTIVFSLVKGYLPTSFSGGMSKLISLVFASGAAILWNFFANKYWTYKQADSSKQLTVNSERRKKKILYWAAFAIVTLAAAFFRFYMLKSLPGGLHPDVAANGLDGWDILHGKITPFFTANNGREGLLFYLVALLIKIFGVKAWSVYGASAIVSFLTVPFLFLLLRRWFNLKVAFLAAFFMAVSYWPVILGRDGFRANLVPVFTVLFLYLATLAWQERNRTREILYTFFSGVALGLGFYSYISYRMIVVFVLLFFFLILLSAPSKRKNKLKTYLLSGGLGFVLSFAPLAYFFLKNPSYIMGRASQVSIFNPDLNHGHLIQTLFAVLGKTIWGFIGQGDANWRHNVSGLPFVPYFLVPFFIIGLGMALYFGIKSLSLLIRNHSFKYMEYFVVIFLWLIFLVPEVATGEGIPHGLRLVGTLPFTFVLTALGIVWLLKKINKNLISWIVIIIFAAGSFTNNYYLLFKTVPKNPDYFYAYRRDLTDVANEIRARNDKASTYLVLDGYSEMTVKFLTIDLDSPYQILDQDIMTNCPRGEVIFSKSNLVDADRFLKRCPDFMLARETFSPTAGDKLMSVYTNELVIF